MSFQSSVIPGYTAYDRFARYSDYAEMMSYPILNKALSIYADESTQKDEMGKIITIDSENKDVQEKLQDLVDNVLQLNGKRIYKIVRDMCKYGDALYLIDITEKNGVVNLIHMPVNEIEREEGFDPDEPTAVRFKWNTRNTTQTIPNAFVAHFRLDGDDLFHPYGQSILEGARRPWRQLVLLEDSMMVYRITRSAERRAFYLDVMGAPPESVEQIVNDFNQEIKKKKVTNNEGKIDLRYGATLDMTEDYVIPVRGSDSATRIETLPGGQNIGDIEDIEFIRSNLFSAIGIPKAFLTYDEGIGSKQVLTTEDIRFARSISKIQEALINELIKICLVHLYVNGFRGKDLVNFKVKMTNPSTVAEMQKNELWRARMELVSSAGQGVFDTTFIYKNFLKLSDDAINMIRKGQIQDKIFEAKLMAVASAGGQMPGMDGGMGGMGMGGGMGAMGGGMGGMDMGGGMPPMDMGGVDPGGAAPNVMGMPESFDPNKRKDLTRRNANERIATERGHGENEIFDMDQVADMGTDEVDLDGIYRNITSPMGAKESVEFGYTIVNGNNFEKRDLISYLESISPKNSGKGLITEETRDDSELVNLLEDHHSQMQERINKVLI